MVSIFGESMEDRRDYRMGLAGLLAGVHALRILAEQRLASAADITLSINGIREVLDTIPQEAWRPGEREHLDGMLLNIISAASPTGGQHG